MMKKIVAIATLALMSGTAFSADVLSGGVRWGETTVEQEFAYTHEFKSSVGQVNVGLEVEAIQEHNDGPVVNMYNVNAGMPFELVGTLVVEPFAQVGVATVSYADDTQFWGAGLSAEMQVVGPVSVGAEYRYRKDFDGLSFEDQRASGYAQVTLTDKLAVQAVYYNHFGDWSDKQYGARVVARF